MNASVTTYKQPNSQKVIKPVSKINNDSGGQKNYVIYELHKWINGTYQPTHFLTVRLPENHRSKHIHHTITHLKEIMCVFERALLKRHWNKNHLPFIAFAENDMLDGWHFHILLNKREFTEQELLNAIFTTSIQKSLSGYCLDLLPIIDNVIYVESYSTKQIKIDEYGHSDSDRITLSHDLFHLPYKNAVH